MAHEDIEVMDRIPWLGDHMRCFHHQMRRHICSQVVIELPGRTNASRNAPQRDGTMKLGETKRTSRQSGKTQRGIARQHRVRSPAQRPTVLMLI